MHGRTAARRLLATVLASVAIGAACWPGDDDGGGRGGLRDLLGDYRDWPRAPGYEQRAASREGVHGNLGVDIYYNQKLLAAVEDGAAPWPVGSIAVIDGFTSRPPAGVAIDADGRFMTAAMLKTEAGWWWASWDGGGVVFNEGRPQLCLGCHRDGYDLLLSVDRPDGVPPTPVEPAPDDPARPDFGGRCASFIQCDDDAPVCVTPTHEETYGFCTRLCESDADCASDAGEAHCDISVRDIPGIDGAVRMCSFACSGCPPELMCDEMYGLCLPAQAHAPIGASRHSRKVLSLQLQPAGVQLQSPP